MELTVDAYSADCSDPSKEWSVEQLHQLNLRVAKTLSLTIIHGPIVKWHGEDLHSMTIVAESHISFHLDIPRRRAFATVFSCMDFPVKDVLSQIAATLHLGRLQVTELDRGLTSSGRSPLSQASFHYECQCSAT